LIVDESKIAGIDPASFIGQDIDDVGPVR